MSWNNNRESRKIHISPLQLANCRKLESLHVLSVSSHVKHVVHYLNLRDVERNPYSAARRSSLNSILFFQLWLWNVLTIKLDYLWVQNRNCLKFFQKVELEETLNKLLLHTTARLQWAFKGLSQAYVNYSTDLPRTKPRILELHCSDVYIILSAQNVHLLFMRCCSNASEYMC